MFDWVVVVNQVVAQKKSKFHSDEDDHGLIFN